jgi:hypothetical protein
MMKQLLSKGLPLMHTFHKWNRLFSLVRDGSSFVSFLHRVRKDKKTLAVVETTRGEKFGFYANDTWKNRPGAAAFYGNGESFLFRWEEGAVRVWKWSGQDNYFQLCDEGGGRIIMGGGGGFGVCLEDDFTRGSSAPCGTFGVDEPMCGRAEGGVFDILNFEVFGFVGEL